MKYQFIIDYCYGEVGNTVGCNSYGQAKEIAEGIALWVTTTTGEKVNISILDVKTGKEETFVY
jgi:hypothetical protein